MMKLILVRHGETEMNIRGCYGGWRECDLTTKGLAQAERVTEKLRNEKINLIISSDLSRAIKTAVHINRHHGIEHIITSHFREMNFGIWEGLGYKEIAQNYPHELINWEKNWIDYVIPQGESVRQMYQRVISAVDQLVDQYKTSTILIVSHAGCIRAILCYLIGRGIEDYWKYKIDHCGITKIQIVDGFAVLMGLNQ